jgi:hypothetical protein
VVSQLAHRWGARWTQDGKIVWCEQLLPAGLSPGRQGASLSRPVAWCPA